MGLSDLIWIVPCCVIVAVASGMWVWGRTVTGVVATAERLLETYRHDEAETRFREALASLSGSKMWQTPVTVRCLKGLAETVRRKGMIASHSHDHAQADEAINLFEQALGLSVLVGGSAQMEGELHERIAVCKVGKGDHAGALINLRAVVQYHENDDKSDSRDSNLGIALGKLGASLFELKQYGEAEPLLRRYLSLQDPELPCGDVVFAFGDECIPSLCLVHTLNFTGKHEEAAELLRSFVEHLIKLEAGEDGKPMSERIRQVELLLVIHGRVLLNLKKGKEAYAAFALALERRLTDVGAFHESYDDLVQAVVEACPKKDPFAAKVVADMVAAKEAASSAEDIRLLFPLQRFAAALAAAGRNADAEVVLRRACALERKYRPDVVPGSQTHLVNVLLKQNKVKAARALAREVATKTV